ncbi:MAG: hypothetical protein COU69_03305 [Candidatus Pacebacteria bacterium CG10_big_fil_rev_8_21_14_0_10_56_10]|nr:MAG: hypothetical protein COU69_03305 [Candidatus Pacebacteria bacterium CG10_big_fil_rev_8_21_14_0_10_56_10]
MKKIVFYSFNGVATPTLAALAYFKPSNVYITWYIQSPIGKLYSEFLDAIVSVKQLGFKYSYFSNSLLHSVNAQVVKNKLNKFFLPYAQQSLHKPGVEVVVVGQNWQEILLSSQTDGLVLSSIRTGSYQFYKQLSQHQPIFLHEYGNSLKKISAFDLFPERHRLLSSIFFPGKKYYSQAISKSLQSKSVITGASKSDFYSLPYIFPRPTDKPFLVYCNTVSHIDIYDNKLSEPLRRVDNLVEACRKAGFELVIKLHPHTYHLFSNAPWRHRVYCNAYSADLFRQAAGIISDPSSLMLESFLANKPLFVPQPNIKLWPQLKTILSVSTILDENVRQNAKLINKAVDNFSANGSYRKIKELWWHLPDGKASRRIWKNILKKL